MSLKERKKRYQAIEDARGRPLIVYVTSTRSGSHGLMAPDVIREFIDQIELIEAARKTRSRKREVDIFLHCRGGDALVAWKLMSALRERFNKVCVIVPLEAFSAATIFSLGADVIVMHPYAALGPIDPQISVQLPDGKARSFAYEDVGAYLEFVTEDAGLTDQEYVRAAFEKLCETVDPLVVGAAKRSAALSATFGEKLLCMHMTGAEDRQEAARISEALGKSFFSHGHAVSRTEAKALGLKIVRPSPDLERLMWSAYEEIEADLRFREPHDPLAYFLNDPAGQALLTPPQSVVLPAGLPPPAAQQLFQQLVQQLGPQLLQPGVSVDCTTVHALVESARGGSEFRIESRISVARTPDPGFSVNVVNTLQQWVKV